MTSILRSAPFVAACFVLLGCGTETFDTQDSGRSVTFDVGDQFEVHLPGDRWELESLNQIVLKPVEVEAEEPSEEEGVPPTILGFECAAPGTTHMVIAELDSNGHLAGSFNLDVRCKGEAAEAEEVEEE